jgi:hypothetical protein
MAANKIVRFGPVALAAAAANIINPPVVSGGVGLAGTNTATYLIIRHLRIVNKTAAAATFSLYVGLTGGSAAGTEVVGTALSVAANSAYDWYGMLRLDTADFLSGLASAATTLTIEGEGEIGVV